MSDGLELMLVGMGTVFVFLTILVGTTTLMSHIVVRLEGNHLPAPGHDGPGVNDTVVAAVAAAIRKHRSGDH